MTLGDQTLGQLDHALHVLRSTRLMIGTQDVQSIVVFMHRGDEARREDIDRLA